MTVKLKQTEQKGVISITASGIIGKLNASIAKKSMQLCLDMLLVCSSRDGITRITGSQIHLPTSSGPDSFNIFLFRTYNKG